MFRRHTVPAVCLLTAFALILSGCCIIRPALPALKEKPDASETTAPAPSTDPTAETTLPAAGSPVPYADCGVNGGYVLPESGTRYYSREDLWLLTPEELTVARWEICARHGCIVSDRALDRYFRSKDWYLPSETYRDDLLSETERNNLAILDACILKRQGNAMSDDNPYRTFTGDFLIFDSDERQLTAAELAGMTADQLKAARNEIYARHGYIFKDTHLSEYFMTRDWYFPTVLASQTDRYALSKTERANVDTIGAVEDSLTAKKASDLVSQKEQGVLQGFEYRVPKIRPFSEGAVTVQDRIEEQFDQIMSDVRKAADGNYSPIYYTFDYEAHLFRNILFIVIWVDCLSDDGYYTVYAVDVDSGKALDRAGALEKAGIPRSQYLTAVKNAGTKEIQKLEDYADGEYYESLLEQTVNSENLERSQFFCGSDGTAYVVLDVASVAGGGIDNRVLVLDLG